MKHQTSQGDQTQANKHGWKSLAITRQAAKTGDPSKRAFHDPSARQKHKPRLETIRSNKGPFFVADIGRMEIS